MAEKNYKTFIGVDLDYSNHEYISWPFHHHLFDENITIGTNVTHTDAARNAITYPTGSTGECLNLVFVYPSFLSSEAILDGTIEGQVIARLYAVGTSSSYTMYLKGVYITLFKYKSDGTTEDIVAETAVWTGTISMVGDGTNKIVDTPIAFTLDVEDVIPRDALLALKVRFTGYLSSSVSSMYYQVLCSPTNGDLKLIIPFVEDE